MNPTKFKQANTELQAPKGMANCELLPVFRYSDKETKSTVYLSCWKLTLKERLLIMLTGKAWLWVWQWTHPPVAIVVENPFGTKEDK